MGTEKIIAVSHVSSNGIPVGPVVYCLMNGSTVDVIPGSPETFHPGFTIRVISFAVFDPEFYGARSAQPALCQSNIDLVDLVGSPKIGREHEILIERIPEALGREAVAEVSRTN
jgi:hypothetical protein